ncbi:hypothetical protein I5U44_22125, partial [Stenotrophomonas maltophilia]|nr:hypothetical protein [Stenotrophomonas maltophilia]
EQLLKQAGDSLAVAFALFAKADRSDRTFQNAVYDDELASRFFGRLGIAVRHRLDDAAVTDQVTQVLALPSMDLSAVDMELVSSPIRRSQLRAQLSAGGAA